MAPVSSRRRTPPSTTTLLLALFLIVVLTPATYVAALVSPYFDACEPHPPVIGVDLGTTYSRVAVFRDGQVEKIITLNADQQGNRTTPSWLLPSLSTSRSMELLSPMEDGCLAEYFIELVRQRRRHHGLDDDDVDIAGDVARAMEKLRRECEHAKRALSSQRRVRVDVEALVDGVDLSEELTRARFEEVNGDLFRKAMVPVRKALADAGLSKADVDDVVLVGGGAWIPMVRRMLVDYFDGKEPAATRGVNPDEAVAYGAALHAALLIRLCSFQWKPRRTTEVL